MRSDGADRSSIHPAGPNRLAEIEALLRTAHLLADELSLQGAASPFTAVIAARELVTTANDALRTAVAQARKLGATWQDIGDLLATTRQAAFQRFGTSTAVTAPLAATGDAPDVGGEPRARARAVLEAWAAGRHAEVLSRSHRIVTARVDAAGLAAVWADLTARMGPLRSLGEVGLRHVGDMTVAEVPMRFEAGTLLGRVSTNPDGSILGLTVVTAAGNAATRPGPTTDNQMGEGST
jgi:hypothetical protein